MRRLWWLGAGYAAGLGTAAWLRAKVRSAAQRYTPEQLRQNMVDRSRDMGERARGAVASGSRRAGSELRRLAADVREAAQEGRDTMRHTEDELRSAPPDDAISADPHSETSAS